jgi:hypothetical protein
MLQRLKIYFSALPTDKRYQPAVFDPGPHCNPKYKLFNFIDEFSTSFLSVEKGQGCGQKTGLVS